MGWLRPSATQVTRQIFGGVLECYMESYTEIEFENFRGRLRGAGREAGRVSRLVEQDEGMTRQRWEKTHRSICMKKYLEIFS